MSLANEMIANMIKSAFDAKAPEILAMAADKIIDFLASSSPDTIKTIAEHMSPDKASALYAMRTAVLKGPR